MFRLAGSSHQESERLFIENRDLNCKEHDQKASVLQSSPLHVFMQLDAPCNHDCVFCSRPQEYEYFNLEVFKARFAGLFGVFDRALKIHLTGAGEFLLLPDAHNILEFFDKEFHFSEKFFATNGSVFSPLLFSALMACESKFTVQVSLHASNRQLHQKLTGKDDFECTIDNIRRLVALQKNKPNLHVVLSFLMTGKNLGDMNEFLLLSRGLGIRNVWFGYNSVYKPAQKQLSCFFEQDAANRALERAAYLGKKLELDVMLPLRFKGSFDYYKQRRIACSEPWTHVMLNFKGEVLPCCNFENGPVGNVLKEDFMSVWNNGYYRDVRTAIAKSVDNKYCHNCHKNRPEAVNDLKGHMIVRGKGEQELLGNADTGLTDASLDLKLVMPADPKVKNLYERKNFVWRLNEKCNYACSYCSVFSQGKGRKDKFSSLDLTVEAWLDRWDSVYDKYGSVNIHIVGGEPTAYRGFFDLVLKLSKKHYIGFDTNLSADFDSFIQSADPRRFSFGSGRELFGIGASYHPAFADFDEFMIKAQKLELAGFNVWINYVAYPPQLYKAESLREIAKEKGLNLVLQPFYGEFDGKVYPQDYTDEERSFINSFVKGDDVQEENMLYQLDEKSVSDKLCYAGMKFAFIHADGKVTRCAEDHSVVLGNIADKGFSMLETPALCRCRSCYCEFKWLVDHRDNRLSIEEKAAIISQSKDMFHSRKDVRSAKKLIKNVVWQYPSDMGAVGLLAEIYRYNSCSALNESVKKGYVDLSLAMLQPINQSLERASLSVLDKQTEYLVRENTFLNNCEFAERKIVLNSTPSKIFIQASGPCNSNCVFCSREDIYEYFDLGVFIERFEKRLFHFIRRAQDLVLTGSGEFLQLPQAEKILDFFNKEFPYTRKIFSTNGLSLRPKIVDNIVNSNNEYTIHVSLHASNSGLHKVVTGTDDFHLILGQLKYLLKMRKNNNKPKVVSYFVANSLNITNLSDFVLLANKLGVDKVICCYNFIYRSEQKKLSCFFYQALTEKSMQEAGKLANNLGLTLELPPRFGSGNHCVQDVCNEAWVQIMLDSKGDILPCDASMLCSENLLKNDLMEIWNGQYYQNLRKALIERKNGCFKHCLRANPSSVNDLRSHVIARGRENEILR
jgi:MoaA/NifB/PqqE/SkfB family radical SAM enzyme